MLQNSSIGWWLGMFDDVEGCMLRELDLVRINYLYIIDMRGLDDTPCLAAGNLGPMHMIIHKSNYFVCVVYI